MYILFKRRQFLIALAISHTGHEFFVSLNKRKIKQKSKFSAWGKQAPELMPVTTRREGWDIKMLITAILQLLASTFNKNNFLSTYM